MKFKINKGLLPIKIHFFFFFAALGPLLPQMNVFGKQLGVSPTVMGLVTAVLPLLWAAAKPLFGYVVDFWPAYRKLVFMLLIMIMTGSYCGLWFLPVPDPAEQNLLQYIYSLNDTIYIKEYDNNTFLEKYSCQWNCTKENERFEFYLSNSTFVNTVYISNVVSNESCSLLHMDFDDVREGEIICVPIKDCNLLCFDESTEIRNRREVKSDSKNVLIKEGKELSDIWKRNVSMVDSSDYEKEMCESSTLYMTATFWVFVVLMCMGTVAFNVANCIGDAVCFDVLGSEQASKYGGQRAWGTAGYGVTALLGGWLVDACSPGDVKDFTPAFLIAIVATVIDLFSCRALTLPSLSSPEDSGKALLAVLKLPRVLLFITFAVVAGTFDSFIIYYMFWFLEDLADETGHRAKIKLIEGVVVAGQSFVGELLFFYFSGKILKRWGYGTTMTFSLFCYGVRMALISVIQNPWHLVFIEAVMQGPTYALCYSAIVGYAAHVAPPGYSATVQGIVAGMDDGVGFALGSLVGGALFAARGGRGAFRLLALAAGAAAAAHAALFRLLARAAPQEESKQPETPEEGEKMLQENPNVIYKDTVVPLKCESR